MYSYRWLNVLELQGKYYSISCLIQYILANPNSPVPLRKVFVPISEFVRISEIALFLLRINNTNICNRQIWVILLFIPIKLL